MHFKHMQPSYLRIYENAYISSTITAFAVPDKKNEKKLL
jgi:hypothetical protein